MSKDLQDVLGKWVIFSFLGDEEEIDGQHIEVEYYDSYFVGLVYRVDYESSFNWLYVMCPPDNYHFHAPRSFKLAVDSIQHVLTRETPKFFHVEERNETHLCLTEFSLKELSGDTTGE